MSDFNAEQQKVTAAVTTLEFMRYTWTGGIHWRPPLGKKPDFDLMDSLQAEVDKLRHQMFELIQQRDALMAGAAHLINQVEMGTYTDEMDHNLKNNQAFVFLKEKLNDPKGYVLVPVEPTPKMIDATWNYDDEIMSMSSNKRNQFIYGKMIAAAREDG